MKPKLSSTVFFLCGMFILFLSCNQAPESTNDNQAISGDPMKSFVYDPALDPIKVGADFTDLLADTLGIKMSISSVLPGQSWEIHKHPDHAVYLLEGGRFTLYTDISGRVDTVEVPSGAGIINGPLADSGTNVGNTTIKFLVMDVYRPRSKED